MKHVVSCRKYVRPICPLALKEVRTLPKAVAALDFQMKSTARSTAKPFVMTRPSVSVPQKFTLGWWETRRTLCLRVILWRTEQNRYELSLNWARGGTSRGLGRNMRARTHTCGDASDGSVFLGPHAFALIWRTWTWASPSSRHPPSRSVALFVIVIWPVFVKGSRTICSCWRVYTCTRVCIYRRTVTSLRLVFFCQSL